MKKISKVAVIGAGAWGTALAQVFAQAGVDVTLWMRKDDVAEMIRTDRVNHRYLPDVALSSKITPTTSLEACGGHDALIMVTPAQYLREIGTELSAFVTEGTPVLIASKGIELETLRLLSDVAKEVFPMARIGVLSGPNFAREIAEGKPAAATLALENADYADQLAQALSSSTFRIYSTTDVVGAQVGGAVKNVLAIACGMIHGRDLGENARAALLTRGLHEISRLSQALGGRYETLMGLSGLGDMTLTCGSLQSRNMSLGAELGQGKTLQEIMAGRHTVSEGVYTAKAVDALAHKMGIEMPISAAVKQILYDGAHIDHVMHDLMTRPIKVEHH